MKARELINTIQTAIDFPARLFPEDGFKQPENFRTCDVIHCGDPEREVKKVATTFMVTYDVVRRAIADGVDMIITHEPTPNVGSLCGMPALDGDVVSDKKRKLLEDSGIVVWRCHDGMHFTRPDLIYVGWMREFGWEAYNLPGPNNHFFRIPETTLGELCELFKTKLGMDAVRYIGSPDMSIKNVGVLVGGGSMGLGDMFMPVKSIIGQDLDTLVCGDVYELFLNSYVADARSAGLDRSMIILGHERTEEPGMKYLPEWLKTNAPGPEYVFIPAGDPLRSI